MTVVSWRITLQVAKLSSIFYLVVCVVVGFGLPGNTSLARTFDEGRYAGVFGGLGWSGHFELTQVSENTFEARFQVDPAKNDNELDWGMDVEIHVLGPDKVQLTWPDNPRNLAGTTLLKPIDTPQGLALLGTIPVEGTGETWTEWAGFWLDQSLDSSPFAPWQRGYPEFREESMGRFRLWGAEPGGLANNATRCLIQTADGYIWVGTVDGLSRFDGKNWQSFDSSTSPELPGYNFRGLVEDNDGHLIAMVKHWGLFRLVNDVWKPFACNNELEGKIGSGLSRDSLGNFWFSLDSKWLARIDANEKLTLWSTDKVLPLRHPKESNLPRLGGTVSQSDWILLETSGGMRSFRPDSDSLPFWIPPIGENLACISVEANGTAVVSFKSIVYHYDDRGRVTEVYYPRTNSGSIRHARSSRQSGVWVAGSNGLFLMPNPSEIIHFGSVPAAMTEFVTEMMEDMEGNLWIATGGRGLCQFRRNSIRSIKESVWAIPDSDQRSNPLSIVKNQSGIPMIAGSRSIAIWDEEDWKSTVIQEGMQHKTLAFETGQDENNLWVGLASYLDQRDRIAMQSNADPLPVAVRVSGREKQIFSSSALPTGLAELSTSVWIPGEGFWLGSNLGVWVCDDNEVWSWNDRQGFSRFSVSALFVDSSQRVWIGTNDEGLYLRSRPTSEVKHFSSRDQSLFSSSILSIAETASGDLWLAGDQGVQWFDPESKAPSIDLSANVAPPVHSVLQDRSGNLWAGTSRGIYVLKSDQVQSCMDGDNSTAEWALLGSRDGIRNPSISLGYFPVGTELPNGELIFCMQDTLIRFHPSEVLGTMGQGPDVRISGCMDGSGEEWIGNILDSEEPLNLSPDAGKHIKIDFGVIHFSEPDLVRFRYRLSGKTTDWTELGKQNFVWLFDLTPGVYRLEVEAIDHHLQRSLIPASLFFYVAPYFHQTFGFKIGVVVCVLFCLWTLHRQRFRKQVRVQAINNQFRLEADRRRIARDMHDEIGTSFAQLKILGELVQNGRLKESALSNSIARMVALARAGSQTLREAIWSLESESAGSESLGDFLGATLENLLDGTGIKLDYHDSWEGKQPALSPRFKREVILITKGITSNVIRHSQATRFRCELRGEGDFVHLIWEDNGVGYEPKELSGDSFGIQSIAERVERLGGVFEPQTRHGVSIQVKLDSKKGE